MKYILIALISFLWVNPLLAQEEIFTIVETNPEFPGGDAAMYAFLGQNIHYPAKARDNNIQGRVYVSFVVEKNGRITDVRILRGIGGGCDKEALRVVKTMPNWSPGYQRGKAVRVRFNLPIVFKLQGKTKKKRNRNSVEASNDKVYYLVDEYPVLQTREKDLDTFLYANLIFPEGLMEPCTSHVGFIIEKDGTISHVRITKPSNEVCDKEALRLIKLTNGKWVPAKKFGQNVRIEYYIPVEIVRK